MIRKIQEDTVQEHSIDGYACFTYQWNDGTWGGNVDGWHSDYSFPTREHVVDALSEDVAFVKGGNTVKPETLPRCQCGHDKAQHHYIVGCLGDDPAAGHGVCRCMEFRQRPEEDRSDNIVKFAVVTMVIKFPVAGDEVNQTREWMEETARYYVGEGAGVVDGEIKFEDYDMEAGS